MPFRAFGPTALLALFLSLALAHCGDVEDLDPALERRALSAEAGDEESGALAPEDQLLPDPLPPAEAAPPISWTIDDLRALGESSAYIHAVAAAQDADPTDAVIVAPTLGRHRERCVDEGAAPSEPVAEVWEEADEALRDRSTVPLRVRLAALPDHDTVDHEHAVRGPAEATPVTPWPDR